MSRGISLYVHVPFCASRCPYCDFATAPAMTALRARYLASLGAEIGAEGRRLGRPRVRTLYVGGGTPSLLEPDEVASLATALREAFDLRPREATVEANPATLDRARIAAWRDLGITRLSLGAQSFSLRGLRALGRTHAPEDTESAVTAARSAGFDVNLDLIFGWPGETLAEWAKDLAAAMALAPDHLSCYPLELRLDPEESVANWPGGGWPVLERWRRRAAAGQPADEIVARMYRLAERFLARQGFRHYEIANWARPGKLSLHNLAYWRDREWLGVGMGAHSHLGGVRSSNPGELRAYVGHVERGVARRVDGESDPLAEAAILALRLDSGLDLDRYARRFGDAASARVRAALASPEITPLLRVTRDRLFLNARGRLLASEVFVRLLS